MFLLNIIRISLQLAKLSQKSQETHQEMRIPERDVTYIVLFVYLFTLIH